MEAYKSCLIVGADGAIGSALYHDLSAKLPEVRGTTRRKTTTTPSGSIYQFDLFAGPPYPFGSFIPEVVFVCAAATSFSACEANPEATEKINVHASRDIIRHFLGCGSFVVFLSSSAVFCGRTKLPDESSPPTHTTEYGKQKALAESLLIDMDRQQSKIAIVRLTKVLSRKTPLVMDFISKINARITLRPFADLVISPISLGYVLAGLHTIALNRVGGIFHLSGAEDLSYADFARQIATALGASIDLVQPATSEQQGIHLIYAPTFPSLGMKRTKSIAGISAEKPKDVIKAICG